MTDGIIQQVFQKYYYKFESHEQDMLNKMEQELIEKIKQYHFDDDRYFDDTVKKVLIGDNQE